MSYQLLQRFIESEHFHRDPSLTIQYLSRYSDHLGICYALCQKLRSRFSYEQLEFFLPQLCHLVVAHDNESMALEEFLVDLCEESVNSALLTFWLFQTYLRDLSSNPQSAYFQTCRRIYNKIQRIVFGADTRRERIRDNVLPATVLSSLILSAVAAPFLPAHAGPLAIAQGRRPRPAQETLSDGSHTTQTQKLGRSHTVSGNSPSRTRRKSSAPGHAGSPRTHRRPSSSGNAEVSSPSLQQKNEVVVPIIKEPPILKVDRSALLARSSEAGASTSSLPLPITNPSEDPVIPSPPRSAGLNPRLREQAIHRRHSHANRHVTSSSMTREQKVKMLRTNYFRSETAFLTALEDISNRLVIVPKPARLSALRAELALIAQDLPAEVDIPVICPANLDDGQPGKSKHHRIVRLNPAEATSLNSAERVPYLLMVEVLRDDFDFDPDTEENVHLLAKILAEKNGVKRRLFDITDANRDFTRVEPTKAEDESVLEPANGDLGNMPIVGILPAEEDKTSSGVKPSGAESLPSKVEAARSSSGTNARSSLTALSTPRSSLSRANSPAPWKMTGGRIQGADQSDVSALATHMRAAAQMLAQLEQSSSKRPKAEVAAIRNKIIASMQNLEEQSFFLEDPSQPGATFETIMAKADADIEATLDLPPDTTLDPGAGAARMENDQKTGGVQRQGDRDDPSAATVGEEWSAKKERIRKSSPFGWMKNWDLVSVIVKTGADLRQEAFACQLIQVCSKIWEDARVPVWVKHMRILVTGESSGLIETITNGVSLHSIKRSLTLSTIAAATNPRKRIATLRDHFEQAFGPPEGKPYAAAADAFARSLAAYSIISYVLQLKDRHNGNILIDNAGHIIHIDFGFMLSNSPGSMGFEAAPFKLTQEYIDVLGGVGSAQFDAFKSHAKAAFQALRKDAEKIVMLVDVMGKQSQMPCFRSGVETAVNALRARFVLHLSREEAEGYVEELVAKSAGSYYTRLYDTFQYRTQGIY